MPQPTTNQQTGFQMSRQGLYLSSNGHKCLYWDNNGRPRAKHPNFSIGSKYFGTHISGKPPRHLPHLHFFGQAWHQMGQKGQYLAQNDEKCQMWLFLHALSCHLEKEVDVCKGRVILARKYSINGKFC